MKNLLLALFLITAKSGFCQETKLIAEDPFPVFKNQINDTSFISNKDFIGKITFINYWFKGCHPCIAELAGLDKCYNLLKEDKNFQFISFSTDTPSVIAESKEKFKINFPVYHLGKKQAQELHFLAAPTNVIVDKKGILKAVFTGGSTDSAKAYQKIMEEVYPVILKEMKR